MSEQSGPEPLVRDLMEERPLACYPDAALSEVAKLIGSVHRHLVAVTDEQTGKWLGVILDTDIVWAYTHGQAHLKAGDLMSPALLAVPADATLNKAVETILDSRVRTLLVVQPETGEPLGILSTDAIVRDMLRRPSTGQEEGSVVGS